MPLFAKESLDILKEKVDLVEVVSSYLPVKKTGKTFKICCPFHNEKTPSFVLERGDSHYHCFGCGAHGDAISFLVGYLKISFVEAVEMLGEKFGVTLQYQEGEKKEDLTPLRVAMEGACQLYQFHLLHTEEGKEALQYLYDRGIDLEFVRLFRVGLAPKDAAVTMHVFREKKYKIDVLQRAGLVREGRSPYPFFMERITFPILDVQGNVIGFSARKFKEKTTGGKYINTPETPIFKKSRVLFGLYYSRKEITKQRRAIVVEGQIDALRLIQEGLNLVVAGQGTAFGEEHVEVLKKLGVREVFLAFDGDGAGQEAALKVGNLFQREGIEVFVLSFREGDDPDSILRKEGIKGFLEYLQKPKEYIAFLVESLGKESNVHTPAGKNELVERAKQYLVTWKFPLMVYEAERKIAGALQVPEAMVQQNIQFVKEVRKEQAINADRVLETDLLKWLISSKEDHFPLVQKNLSPVDFIDPGARKLYGHLCDLKARGIFIDILTLAEYGEEEVLDLILRKKVQIEKAGIKVKETIYKILERNWMRRRELVKEDVLRFAQELKNPPKVIEDV